MDGPETNPTDFTMTRGPPYDVTSIPQEITEDDLNCICKLYRIPASVTVTIIVPGEDPTRPSNEVVAVAERFLKCWLTILFPLFFFKGSFQRWSRPQVSLV